MHIIFHIIINFVIAITLRLEMIEIFFVVLGGILIDLDHPLYMIFGKRITSIKEMIKFHKANFKSMSPHFYIFHFLEVIVILLLISFFIHKFLFLFFVGFMLHWICDVIKYFWVYHSFLPWIKYSLLIYYFCGK